MEFTKICAYSDVNRNYCPQRQKLLGLKVIKKLDGWFYEMVKWRCVVCGWVCEAGIPACPPERCPKCGAPKSKFIEVK